MDISHPDIKAEAKISFTAFADIVAGEHTLGDTALSA